MEKFKFLAKDFKTVAKSVIVRFFESTVSTDYNKISYSIFLISFSLLRTKTNSKFHLKPPAAQHGVYATI